VPSTAVSGTSPEFFIDRSLGARGLRRALEKLGYVAHTMNGGYGITTPQTRISDGVWIKDAGARGELILTKDDIRSPESQVQAMEQAAAKVFFLTERRLRGKDQIRWYMNNLAEILKRASRPGPYMYGVHEDHLGPPLPLRPPAASSGDSSAVQEGMLGSYDQGD
jgi:hypothetical protein